MMTDLKIINKVIQPMGPLQSGISLLPKEWSLIVTDLKDCFFTIPLQEKGREKFAFTVSTYNNPLWEGLSQAPILNTAQSFQVTVKNMSHHKIKKSSNYCKKKAYGSR